MPLVDCDDADEWGDYLADNYPASHYPHLRPSGFVRLPSFEWPPDHACEVILAGPPGCGKEATLAALEGPGGFASVAAHDSFRTSDDTVRRWSHRTTAGEHRVATLAGKDEGLAGPQSITYRYTLNSIFDRIRPRPGFRGDRAELLEELTELTSRRRVWVFYLRGTPGESYARLGPSAGPFSAHLSEHAAVDAFYTRPTACPHVTVVWVDGKSADEIKDAILDHVMTFAL